MLKTLKWIYKLGVHHERHRVAAFLQSAQNRRYDDVRTIEQQMGMNYRLGDEEGTMDEVEKQRLKEQVAVDKAVIDIISQMFHGEQKYERGASFMFPEDKE